jgi:aldoxime dehydratase
VSVRRLVLACFGTVVAAAGELDAAGADPAAEVAAALTAPDGPAHHDRAVTVGGEPGDPTEVITIGYWADPAAFDRWFARHRDPWLTGGTGGGRLVEVIRPRVERYETIFGGRGRPEGGAVLAERFSEPIREHGYWGAMRDRIPAGQTGPLDAPGRLTAERDGRRIRVRPGGTVCLIRSGQDWSDCDTGERHTYLERVEPNLRAGMAFLRTDGPATGCLAQRYLWVLDDAGRHTERTYGLGWWRTLAALEAWSASHPTHLAIFGAFTRMVRAQGGRTRLRLYHEVAVATPDEQHFEYAGCPEGTGLLGALGTDAG